MVLSATSPIQCAFVRWISHCIELDLLSSLVAVCCFSDYLSSFFFLLLFLLRLSLLLTLLGSQCWLTGLGSGNAIDRDTDSCPSLTSQLETGNDWMIVIVTHGIHPELTPVIAEDGNGIGTDVQGQEPLSNRSMMRRRRVPSCRNWLF